VADSGQLLAVSDSLYSAPALYRMIAVDSGAKARMRMVLQGRRCNFGAPSNPREQEDSWGGQRWISES